MLSQAQPVDRRRRARQGRNHPSARRLTRPEQAFQRPSDCRPPVGLVLNRQNSWIAESPGLSIGDGPQERACVAPGTSSVAGRSLALIGSQLSTAGLRRGFVRSPAQRAAQVQI